MKYLDHAFAWVIFLTAVIFVVVIETTHPRGGILDVPILWILVAMMNFLRLRNGYAVRGLGTFCIGANLIVWLIEIVRLKVFGSIEPVLVDLGPCTLIAGAAVSVELIFSIAQLKIRPQETAT